MKPNRHRMKLMSSLFSPAVVIIFITFLHFPSKVSGHGRLIEPPSRSSMWRFGFKTKPNYNDNELFCGGYTVQWQRNGGRCGVCGDSWNLPSPRPNEAGGVYGRGIIVRKYKPGQVIKSTVDITANHMGFFEFKLCPHNKPTTVVTQECLDQFLLELADGSGTKYYPSAGTGPFSVQLRLPSRVTCSQCVFQWTYTAGNNWGRCENGTSKVGCGPQETFRGCADVSIDDFESNDIPSYNERPFDKPSISAIPTRRTTYRPRTYKTRPSTYKPRTTYKPRSTYRPRARPSYAPSRKPYYNRQPSTRRTTTTRRPRPTRPTRRYNAPSRQYPTRRPRPTPYAPIYTPKVTPYRPFYTKAPITKKPRPTYKPKNPPRKTTNIETEGNHSGGGCRAVGVWASIAGIASWCDSNCARGYCPSTHCDCS
ncbi:uncharacterized protein LOC129217070 [Uloborus diversus]|uniref:uncharacterized protein LOC129217070 n=1 Tax=Uloborus diversus TaxID=327109 RepID=UPI0024099EE1|nr:uncharacterized protein LOC129217070 [Uloborus diversus]XP_054707292.1 uncharacterized protein LOC129217070 [Uloborus diversus]